MSLLGIDIGTTGCKALAFSLKGEKLAGSYREYEIIREQEGYAELDTGEVWQKVMETISEVALETAGDPIRALSVSSLGEAMVPVSVEGKILGRSILGTDSRGSEFPGQLADQPGNQPFYELTGNLPGTFSSMSKLAWLKKYNYPLYHQTALFLTWADFVCFMLGGEAVTNYSLAGRTLLFNPFTSSWSEEILDFLELDCGKLAPPAPSGRVLGYVTTGLAKEINLPKEVAIVSGGHDQCCATLGCGITGGSGSAMYGMGTFVCVVSAFSQIPDPEQMYVNKLHLEHHVVPEAYVTFFYNLSGGALVKWFRQNFYSACNSRDHWLPDYEEMFAGIPDEMNDILVYPAFGTTGPPGFLPGDEGRISGISLNHTRGDLLRAVLEGISFYVREHLEILHFPFGKTGSLVATGGGSVSDRWLQITADVLDRTVIRNRATEAGSLGAAMIAGVGAGIFAGFDEAVEEMVHLDKIFTPDPAKKEFYLSKFRRYKSPDR